MFQSFTSNDQQAALVSAWLGDAIPSPGRFDNRHDQDQPSLQLCHRMSVLRHW